MINSSRFRQSCLIVLFSSVLTILASCQQELLDSPSFESRQQSYTGVISAPTNISATQGGYREIVLTWKASVNARQYCIYSSASSTGTFTKFAETADETPSFTDRTDSGILRHYKISAVDSYGNESSLSNLTFGSTLSTPVITKIDKDSGGTSVTVHWYGGSNVFESTYLKELRYEVVLYDVDGTTILREIAVDGTQSSLTFDKLEANRQYYFQVKAYLLSSQDDNHTEKSELVNESTARRLIPDAPAELTAKKGVSGTEVELSWKLPSSVDVKSGIDYIPHPVYFKVLRKELSAADDTYEPLAQYIGVVKGNEAYSKDSLKESEYRINCQDGTVVAAENGAESLITVKKPDSVEEQTNAYYPEYISGTTITFVDKKAQIGKQYSYLVQSYSDDNGTRLVTSEESVATDSGWLITNPSLRTKVKYAENEDNTLYTGVTVSFSADFEDFGVPYKYVLYETCYKMNSDGTQNGEPKTQEICIGDSVGGIKGYKKSYQIDAASFSYYSYMLKVYSADRTEEYRTANAPGSVLLVQDKNKQPVIEEFSVKDGFTGYFVLSWLYDERCAYTISWKNTDKNGNEKDDSLDLTESDIKLSAEGEGKTRAVYRHPAENGDSRIYTLTASNGLKGYMPLEDEFRTLRIPELKFTDIEYDKITVSWDADTMSNGTYEVTAQYADNAEQKLDGISYSQNGALWSCVIDKPHGYNCAELSGKEITLTVSTKSTTYSDDLSAGEKADKTAEASVAVRTLGPAATKTRISAFDQESITNTRSSAFDQKSILVKWNEVPGANGYKIYRTKYIPDGAGGWKPEKVDVYYKDAGTFRVSEGEGEIGDDTFCNEVSGEYTLCDTYREPDLAGTEENNQYAESQSQISWGIPYSYTVIPVRDENDFAGDIGAETGQFELKDTSKVVYTDIAEFAGKVKGATYGYGLNLVAKKAESGTTQELEWDKPYSALQDDSAKLVPVVYRRLAGATDAFGKVRIIEDNIGKNRESIDITEGIIKRIEEINKKLLEPTTPNKEELEAEKSNCLEKKKKISENSYSAFEYIVKYCSTDKTIEETISVEQSLIDKLKEQSKTYSTLDGDFTEQNNKGYLLTLQPNAQGERFVASCPDNKTYYERLEWAGWDYSKRAVGPDSMTISIQNNNIDGTYYDFIEITKTNAKEGVSPATGIEDITIEPPALTNVIYVAPKGIVEGTKGTTDGMLKVLRDYKHYYTFKLNRDNILPVSYSDYEDNYIETAYRQITDEELVKTTMLTLADMEQDSGMETHGAGGSWSLTGANKGTFKGSGSIGSELTWSIDNYQHKWRKLPSGQTNVPSFITLNDTGNNVRGRKFSAYLVYLCNGVSGTNDFSTSKLIPLKVQSDVYGEATVHFATGTDEQKTECCSSTKTQRFIVKVERNGSTTFTKEVEGEENCRYWCPITWYKSGGAGTQSGTGYFGENSTYGWW